MRPSEPRAAPRSVVLRRPSIGTAVSLLLTAGGPAAAHNVMISRGQAVIHADHVDVQLHVAAENLLHWYDLRPNPSSGIRRTALWDAADEFSLKLGEMLLIRDPAGKRLPVECTPPQVDWPTDDTISLESLSRLSVLVRSRYRFAGAPELLMFQVRPAALPVEIPWQVVLSTESRDGSSGTALRLTSHGNTEFVELSWRESQPHVLTIAGDGGPAGCASCNPRSPRRFKEICAELTIEDRVVSASLHIPLSLLNNWTTLPTDDEGFLEPSGQAAVASVAAELMRRALAVNLNDEIVSAELNTIKVVSVAAAGSSAHDRVSLWTGQLQVSLRFSAADRVERATITWRLFNAVVLSAQILLRAGDQCLHRELSTFDPAIEWRR